MKPESLQFYKTMYQPQAPCVPLLLIAEIERLQAENERLQKAIKALNAVQLGFGELTEPTQAGAPMLPGFGG